MCNIVYWLHVELKKYDLYEFAIAAWLIDCHIEDCGISWKNRWLNTTAFWLVKFYLLIFEH